MSSYYIICLPTTCAVCTKKKKKKRDKKWGRGDWDSKCEKYESPLKQLAKNLILKIFNGLTLDKIITMNTKLTNNNKTLCVGGGRAEGRGGEGFNFQVAATLLSPSVTWPGFIQLLCALYISLPQPNPMQWRKWMDVHWNLSISCFNFCSDHVVRKETKPYGH